jgi:hypothetical protein
VLRYLAYLIVSLLVIAVLRTVMGAIAHFFGNAAAGPAQRAPGRPAPAAPAQALKKDPVCGTFVAPSAALKKEKGGETYYFCSPACRDKF